MRMLEEDPPSYGTSRGIIPDLGTTAAMKANEQALSSMLPVLPSTTALASSFQPWISEPLKPVIHQAQFPCPELADVHVTLENSELWTRFYAIGNEMIITRPGRRMFPVMRVKVSGMVASSYYMMLMDLVPTDNYRYRFLSNCWLPVETATDSSPGETGGGGKVYLHENGPCLGCKWMLAPVDFSAVKLTNQKSNTAQKMMLQSMRKYVPRIHVFAGSDVQKLDFRSFKTFVFPETGFISVTSYQNDQIITLKIQNNPYARSFCSNTDRRNAIRRLTDEELVSVEDRAGHNSIALQSASTEKTFRTSTTACAGTATPVQHQVPSLSQTLPNGSEGSTVPHLQSAYAGCAPSQHLFSSLAPYPTALDLYSSLFSLAPEVRYATNPTGMGESYRPYFQSPYLSAATAPALSPYFLPRFVDGGRSTTSAISAPSAALVSPAMSAASVSSALSMSSATPATSASPLEAESLATPMTSRMSLPFNATTASQHARYN